MIFDPDDMKDAPCADSCEAPKADASQPEGFKFDQSAMIMAMLPLVGATLEKVAKSKQVSTLPTAPELIAQIANLVHSSVTLGFDAEQQDLLRNILVSTAYNANRALVAEVNERLADSAHSDDGKESEG